MRGRRVGRDAIAPGETGEALALQAPELQF
jgi:hypothetical protein